MKVATAMSDTSDTAPTISTPTAPAAGSKRTDDKPSVLASLDSRDPVTGEVIGTVLILDERQIEAALVRAREAADAWSALTHTQRREELLKYRRALANRAKDIVDLEHRENGKPILDCYRELYIGLELLTYAATQAESVLKPRRAATGLMPNFKAWTEYRPLGVVGMIGPWNYPIFAPLGGIASALAAGNAVIFKPSEFTPLLGQLITEIAADSLSIDDVLQTVTGDGTTGAALARAKVDKLAFTGSTATGRRVMQEAAANLTPVALELGGKDPLIVTADADLDAAATGAVFGAFNCAGQACVGIERAYVVDPIYDEFTDKVVALTRELTEGDKSKSHFGPMANEQQVERVRDQLADAVAKGAKILIGGPEHIDGPFVAPTVLENVTDDMKVMQEETFGPVLPLIRVANADEAVRLANESDFGLGSAVYAQAGAKELAERINAGMTTINSVLTMSAIAALPFGGIGDSGFGRTHGEEGLREFSRVQSFCEERFTLPLLKIGFPRNPEKTAKVFHQLIEQTFGGGTIDKARSFFDKLLS